jgi:transcriptional regulator with AAA-type ATPase domain
MDPAQIRAIRGELSRAAFARLLGVTALTVLRWELPPDSKEARRPRAKMIEALRRLAAEGVGLGAKAGAVDEEEDEDASEPVTELRSVVAPARPAPELTPDEARVLPLLERVNGEGWQLAEDELLSLLASGTLGPVGRALAGMGVVQTQVLARMDGRSALAALLPVLGEAERGTLPVHVAARAHVMAAMVLSQPDSRFFDPGRVNAHAARAEELLRDDEGDLHVLVVLSRLAATRFLGADVTLSVYRRFRHRLDRAASPLAITLAEGVHAVVATDRNDAAAAAAHGNRCLQGADRLQLWGLSMAILADYAARTLRASQMPEAILEITRLGKERGRAGQLAPTEPLIRLLGVECEALCRLARFDEALETANEALALAKRGGVARYALTAPLSRLYMFTNRTADLESLAASFELEAASSSNTVARLHEAYLRALLASLAGDYAKAAELCERVSSAPETTPSFDYLIHAAQFELTVSYLLGGDGARARSTLPQNEALLEKRPSVWHAAMFRRTESLLLIDSGDFTQARQKIESTRATFRLLGDVVQEALEDAGLSLVAKATGAPDAAASFATAMKRLEGLGVSTEFLKRRSDAIVPPSQPTWREQTVAEKLVIAMERLSVKGLAADAFRTELATILSWLFPALDVRVGGPELDAAWGEVVEVPSEAAPLRFGVRGALDHEQRATLLLLESLVTRSAAKLAPNPQPEAAADGILPGFIAIAPATRKLKQDISSLSRSNATILITGESGSGKEIVARAVHDLSARRDKPYVVFNCASVPRDLFESQLFGHRKGAFTGAHGDSPGVIRAADGGTLFLDEIGELPLDTQPKLLRFLENAEVLPLGEQRARRVDVRVLAATHRDLARLVREGRFREDLYYRLNVVPLQVAPLRERKEDIPALARLFIARTCSDAAPTPRLGADALRALESHPWPGNVRELRNVIERAMAYSPVPQVLSAEHLRLVRA